MKIAVFSDVHGNLSALQAVLTDIQSHRAIDVVVFAGDLCVFGPRPQACTEFIQEQQIQCVAGNTDHWIFKPPSLAPKMTAEQSEKTIHVRSFSSWTKEQLDEKSLYWLSNLRKSFKLQFSPTDAADDDLAIYHANPHDVNQLIFPPESMQLALYGNIRQKDEEVLPLLTGVTASTIAFGHLHIPSERRIQDVDLINTGSVSMPGDGDPRAKYAILSWSRNSGWALERHFIDYDISPEIDAFRKHRPPYWEKYVDTLLKRGFIPQIV